MSLRDRKVKDFRLALAGSPVTIFFLCSENRFMWFENLQSVWASGDMIGHNFSDAFDDVGTSKLGEALDASTGPDDPQTIVVKTRAGAFEAETPRTLKITLRRVLNSQGERRGAICSSIDITDEVKQSEIQRVLMLEVAHRSKNLLAIVLSLASQTARTSLDIKSFMGRFTGRVQSLAKSQDVITEANWTGVSWLDLVRHHVSSVVPLGAQRLSIVGENKTLSPNASTHVGLALHELVSRSLTEGALSLPDGLVEISLEIDNSEQANFAVMRWRENAGGNGRSLSADDAFSETLLTRVVPAAVGGNGSLTFSKASLDYVLTLQKSDFH